MLGTLADLARLDVARLKHIQTRTDWMIPRTHLPYCFRCLVLTPADVTAPLAGSGHGLIPQRATATNREPLETIRASTMRRATNMEHLLKLVSRYRQSPDMHRRSLY